MPQDGLIRGYRPQPWPLREAKRQWRDVQTRLPDLTAAKFDGFNWLTRRFGLLTDPEIRLLAPLAPIGLAVDVGGHWGQTVTALAYHLRPEKIICCEPNPVLARRLEKVFGGGGIDIVNAAIGRSPGTATLHVPRYRGYEFDGLASLDRAMAEGWLSGDRIARFDPRLLTIEYHEVSVTPLDALDIAPDLIKIDTQGTELEVVMGALDTIARSRPVVIAERPGEALVHLLGKFGLAPWGWDGKRMVAGYLRGNNTIFLTPDHCRRLALA